MADRPTNGRPRRDLAPAQAPLVINGIAYTLEFIRDVFLTVSLNESIDAPPFSIAQDLVNTFGNTAPHLPLGRVFPNGGVWDGAVPLEANLTLPGGTVDLASVAAVLVLAIAFLRLYPSNRLDEAMQMGAVAHIILRGNVPYVENVRFYGQNAFAMLSRVIQWEETGDNTA